MMAGRSRAVRRNRSELAIKALQKAFLSNRPVGSWGYARPARSVVENLSENE
jgi:hypothetical protein